jgi:hypothetical protein
MTFMILHILHAAWIPLFRTSFMNTAWGVFIPCIIWIVAIFVPGDKVTITMWTAIAFGNYFFFFFFLKKEELPISFFHN